MAAKWLITFGCIVSLITLNKTEHRNLVLRAVCTVQVGSPESSDDTLRPLDSVVTFVSGMLSATEAAACVARWRNLYSETKQDKTMENTVPAAKDKVQNTHKT